MNRRRQQEQQKQQNYDTEQQTQHPRQQLQVAGRQGNCNKPQRVLIQNGTVYLTNLVAAEWLGPIEHVGFLVELYEVSQVRHAGWGFSYRGTLIRLPAAML